jgi:16S rRNA (cytidine1402-2'-O)-methyltransferase
MNKDQNFSLVSGTLYIVSLPIGNLDDMSSHAKTVLRLADYIAAEDTRTFKELALKLQIQYKNLISYHEHNEKGSAPELLKFLQQGKTIAIVSDAGTPNISDPGYQILKLCFENNLPVVGIPGPSSLTYALSVCPIGGKSHYFGGFPSAASKERIAEFKEKAVVADRIVFFESPHRLVEHLRDASTVFEGHCLVLRELTKTYEEIIYKPIEEMIAHFENKKPQGEFVIIYPGQEKSSLSLEDLKSELSNLVRENLKPSDILKRVQDLTTVTRREIYDLITEIKHGLKKDSE